MKEQHDALRLLDKQFAEDKRDLGEIELRDGAEEREKFRLIREWLERYNFDTYQLTAALNKVRDEI